jgi:transposase InsO family protein
MIWDNQRSPAPLPVKKSAGLQDISKSGYYAWAKNNGHDSRGARDRPVVEEIMKIIHVFPGYGYRRITRQLNKEGKLPYPVNHKRVLRLMQENNLQLRHKKFRPITTDSEHGNPTYPNLILGLKTERPNQVWGADFTYIQLNKEFVYLAVELDIHTRNCIGWSLSRSLSKETALDALQMALYNRQDDDLSGLIHHSDRGVQYTSFDFTKCLRDHGIQISNSRKATPTDNAYVESFFKTLKYEEVYLNEYDTFEDAWDNIQTFIEAVYNEKRMHSGLGYLSPIEFEQKLKGEII